MHACCELMNMVALITSRYYLVLDSLCRSRPGGGYEPWRSLYRDQWTIALCKEIWRRDYGEEMPKNILSSLHQDEEMILTNFILDTHAQRCGTTMAAMYLRPHSAETSTRKQETQDEKTNERRTKSSAAPSPGRPTNDTQGKDRKHCENSPTPLELAASSLLDIIKLKARWRRQFEAETSRVDKSNNALNKQINISPTPGTSQSDEDKPVCCHTQKETDTTDIGMNIGKTKKAVRFMTHSPVAIEPQSMSKRSNESAEDAEKIEDMKKTTDGQDGAVKIRKTKKSVRFQTSSPDTIETQFKSQISKVSAADVERIEDAKKQDDSLGISIKTRKTKKAVRFMTHSHDVIEPEIKSNISEDSTKDVETIEDAKKEDEGSDGAIKRRKTKKSVGFLTNSSGVIEHEFKPQMSQNCDEDWEKFEKAKLNADVSDSTIKTKTIKKAVRFLTNSPEVIEPTCKSQKFHDCAADVERIADSEINAYSPDDASETKTTKKAVRFMISSPVVIKPSLNSQKSKDSVEDRLSIEDATCKIERDRQDTAIKTRKPKKAVTFMTNSPEVIDSELKSHKPQDCPDDEPKSYSNIEAVGSDSAVKTRKTKKAVRFLTCSPEAVESILKPRKSTDCVETKEHIEDTKKEAGGLDSANKTSNSEKAVGFLTCTPEVIKSRTKQSSSDCAEDEIKVESTMKEHAIGLTEKSNTIRTNKTSKRKQNDKDDNTEAAVSSKKKNKGHKKKRCVYTHKKKKHKHKDKASLTVHNISPNMGIDNINDEEADMEVDSIMRNAGAHTVGPYRIYGLQQNKIITPYRKPQSIRKPKAGTPFPTVNHQAEEATFTSAESDITDTSTEGSRLHNDTELPSTSKQHPTCTAGAKYTETSADSKVAYWLLHKNATPSPSFIETPSDNMDTPSSSPSFNTTPMSSIMRSPCFIDGETGETMPFGPPIRMITRPPETAIPVLALLPCRDGRRYHPDPIKVVGGIDFGDSPVIWTKSQAKTTHALSQAHERVTSGDVSVARKRMCPEDGLEAAVMSKKKTKRDVDFLKKKPLKLTIKKKTSVSLKNASHGVQNTSAPQATMLYYATELPSTSNHQHSYSDSATEPSAAADCVLPQWPSRWHHQSEQQPINAADGVDVDSRAVHCGRIQTNATDEDKADNSM